jgi:hypothetical protein
MFVSPYPVNVRAIPWSNVGSYPVGLPCTGSSLRAYLPCVISSVSGTIVFRYFVTRSMCTEAVGVRPLLRAIDQEDSFNFPKPWRIYRGPHGLPLCVGLNSACYGGTQLVALPSSLLPFPIVSQLLYGLYGFCGGGDA